MTERPRPDGSDRDDVEGLDASLEVASAHLDGEGPAAPPHTDDWSRRAAQLGDRLRDVAPPPADRVDEQVAAALAALAEPTAATGTTGTAAGTAGTSTDRVAPVIRLTDRDRRRRTVLATLAAAAVVVVVGVIGVGALDATRGADDAAEGVAATADTPSTELDAAVGPVPSAATEEGAVSEAGGEPGSAADGGGTAAGREEVAAVAGDAGAEPIDLGELPTAAAVLDAWRTQAAASTATTLAPPDAPPLLGGDDETSQRSAFSVCADGPVVATATVGGRQTVLVGPPEALEIRDATTCELLATSIGP